MKKIFYYLLPLFLLSQSGTAQQDSLTLRITDEKGQIIIGAVVLQYPESYLLGASNEKGEVEIKGLHIPARQQLVFQCLGYEMKALPFQEVKQHPNVRLKEKITELYRQLPDRRKLFYTECQSDRNGRTFVFWKRNFSGCIE